ncbi:peptidoglycan hydrolase-like protein with peptidoglycan-binding domain [Nonomuraea thailandensis]|uniref:Peptidoglycan hydrolase-like protein with peptidoglycan-binding domain n=1 Tax=Nonomuraea thailandensis TaxID=1188745 RepID=A0A9X2GTN8_9ACTN|nr:peptidoglycan-binding protein [Nonomuraea thailandensis]MCP2363657.1 peptidoglycan hydrolase-like protein with peptidoglycan-binding domain [Nonomuraea thailandensis]
MLTGVVVVAGAGWVVGSRLRSPADEAARRAAPPASLVTAAVERRKLVSTVVLSGTLEYGSPLPISLAGVVGGAAELQRATRAPRKGRIAEGAVLMEVNGRPVFVLRGSVPMHRTIAPGTKGDDVRQLQRALRRLGHGAPATGVFDRATIAAVTRMYAGRGYEAQQPTLADRQAYDTLRKAVRTAEETLATERQALDRGRDVLPLKVRLDNARKDLKSARAALAEAESRELTPADEGRLAAAESALRAAEERLLEAEQALAAAGNQPTGTPTGAPEGTPTGTPTGPATGTPAGTPAPRPTASTDTSLLELRVANARADLAAAQDALDRVREEAREAGNARLEELRKAVRTAKDAVVTAEQALRQARQLSPARLKVANAGEDVAAAKGLLAEYARTYGVSIPPGEMVFLPKLPARVQKVSVKAGQRVEAEVATVTSSTFAVTGSVEAAESELLRPGMEAAVEVDTGRTYPARLTAIGERARLPGGEEAPEGSIPVLLTPSASRGLRAGAVVTTRVTVGATDEPVLVVPVAAVITSADGKARVRVEYATDRTRDVEVRTGLTADGNVEVSGALKEGDRVVVSGA